jgi:hypothetical protein
MLARVVFAVACSIAALKYAQFKANRIKRHGSQGEFLPDITG